MNQNFYIILIAFSLLVITSYVFSLISKKFKIPSVLLLLFLGIGVRFAIPELAESVEILQQSLHFFGTLGLILIVLEGALELEFTRKKLPLIRNAFFSALIILLITTSIIALVISFINPELEIRTAVINAIPFSIISSAIAIPSVENVDKERKEFVVYESIFSDILGILLFNFFIMNPVISGTSIGFVALDILIVTLIAVGLTLLIFEFIRRDLLNIRFILLLAVIVLLYVIGKLLHFSSLVIILIFGIILHNAPQSKWGIFKKYAKDSKLKTHIDQFKIITIEGAFMIRTIFFFVFGYSLHLASLVKFKVIILGSIILFVIYAIRWIYLKIFHQKSLSLEFFVAPRGLITILLFYSIPESESIGLLSEGVLFYIILLSGLVMMLGVMKGSTNRYLLKSDYQ